jgi:chemotaxis protein histidine kinase CheA
MSQWASTARTRHGEPALVFRSGPYRFIISSAEIAEVRDLPATASGNLPQSVVARGSTGMLPVVPVGSIFGVASAAPRQLLVLQHRGVAVAIDRIEGVTELREIVVLPRAFHGAERRWYRGLALLDGKILPVVNAAAFAEFTAVPPARAAAAAVGLGAEAKAGA